MAYIGQTLTEGIRRAYTFLATSGQTTFNAVYGVGSVDVFQNGILLQPSDYTATTGTTVVLSVGAAVNDEITILAHSTFHIADVVSAAQGGTFAADVGINTTPTAKLHIDTGTSNDDFNQVLIEGSSDGGSSNPEITLKRNTTSPADGDYNGSINFYGKNSADQDIKYAQVVMRTEDVTDASEDGALAFFTYGGAASRETLYLSNNDTRIRTNNIKIASHLTSGENSAGPTIGLIRNDTTTVTGNVLGTFGFGHTDGSPDFPEQTPQQLPASIRAVAAESAGSGDDGANMEFYTKPINADKDVSSTLNMKIANDGSVTMPNQPAILASSSSIQTFSSTATATALTLGTTNLSRGNLTRSGNNLTVPVTGYYVFHYAVAANIFTDIRAFGVRLYKNGSSFQAHNYHAAVHNGGGAATHYQFTGTFLASLAASDYVTLYGILYDSTSNINFQTQINGYLIG